MAGQGLMVDGRCKSNKEGLGKMEGEGPKPGWEDKSVRRRRGHRFRAMAVPNGVTVCSYTLSIFP